MSLLWESNKAESTILTYAGTDKPIGLHCIQDRRGAELGTTWSKDFRPLPCVMRQTARWGYLDLCPQFCEGKSEWLMEGWSGQAQGLGSGLDCPSQSHSQTQSGSWIALPCLPQPRTTSILPSCNPLPSPVPACSGQNKFTLCQCSSSAAELVHVHTLAWVPSK